MAEPASIGDFGAVYEAHAPFVWRILRRLGVGPGDVDDAAHEVFLVAYRRRTDLRDPSMQRSWLFGIAKRVAHATIRKGRRSEPIQSEPATQRPGPDELVEREQAAELAHQCIEAIDDSRREVFVLVELEDMSGPEVAEALGIELNTVYSRLRKARAEFTQAAELRQRLEVGSG